jgi:hypothetical protein
MATARVRKEYVRTDCSVEVCNRAAVAKGYCQAHFLWSKTNDWAVPTHSIASRAPRTYGDVQCSVSGCERVIDARGLCKSHYVWSKRHGWEVPAHALKSFTKSESPEKAIQLRVEIDTATGCFNWTGYKQPDGYGQIAVNGQVMMAHRFAWQMQFGKVPAGLEVNHTCLNRSCINVQHLEVITHDENIAYSVAFRKIPEFAREAWIQRNIKVNIANQQALSEGEVAA